MATLAIDTALDHAQAAVVEGGAVLGYAGGPAAGDAEAVVDHADAALAAAGLSYGDLSRIAVTVGPGSFTGVRVGIAFAKGVALAASIPAVGVSTLAVIARMAGAPALAAVDARHGAVFAALHLEDGSEALAARMPVAEALALAARHGARIAGPRSALAALGVEGIEVGALDLILLAEAAAGDPAGRAPSALYLAPVDAMPQRHKALARA